MTMYRLSACQSRQARRRSNDCVNETVTSADAALSAMRRLSRTYAVVYVYGEDGYHADLLELMKQSFFETRGCCDKSVLTVN